MRVQKHLPRQAHPILLAVGALLIIGLLISMLQFASRSLIVSAAGDGTASPAGETITTTVYLPILAKAPTVPMLSSTNPTSANAWTVSWTVDDITNVTGYVLEESQTADFATVTSYNLGIVNSQNVTKPASPNNTYYYRIASLTGGLQSAWSEPIAVHGAYFDGFTDDTTGWEKRRFTYLEETNVYYGTGNEDGYLVAITADRWDWVIGSPLRHAPAVPYSVEYRMRVHDGSNLVSGGAVVGGDWTGQACPNLTNDERVYDNNHCFNSFYNFNMIFFGPMKLQFEPVDRLEYCPNCTGSQLKRLPRAGYDNIVVENINGLDNPATDWHDFKITVEEDGLRFYVDGLFVRHFADTAYIDQPYFGVFTSTDEYKPSIYLYDYYKVTPLD